MHIEDDIERSESCYWQFVGIEGSQRTCFHVELLNCSVECCFECSCYWILLVAMHPMMCPLADVMMCSVKLLNLM